MPHRAAWITLNRFPECPSLREWVRALTEAILEEGAMPTARDNRDERETCTQQILDRATTLRERAAADRAQAADAIKRSEELIMESGAHSQKSPRIELLPGG